MKRAANWVFATAVLAVALGDTASCLAADKVSQTVLGVLAGTAVSTAELGREQARGIAITSAVSNGAVSGNSVGPGAVTGSITTNNSINDNVGITTVFQNTGNNALFQSSTSIFISVH